jgi:U4/U6 small nuclear ribonucleoprotein PRP31
VHKELRDAYAVKFSELESIVLNPIDYARAVKVIGNIQGDISKVSELLPWLSNQTLMSLIVSFSASTGRQLTDLEQKEVMKLCEEVISLDHDKQKMLTFLETKMTLIAPNVSAIVGTRVAAKLIAAAGGIIELSRIPAVNIQVLGSQRKALNGMSTATAQLHRGHI